MDQRHARQWVVWGGGLLLLGSLAAVHLLALREQVSAEQEERLVAQLRLVDQGMTRELVAVDEGLRSVVRDRGLWAGDANWSRAELRLKALDGAITASRTLSLLDADGRALASSRSELVGEDFSQRADFATARRDNDAAKLYVSPPRRAGLGGWTLNFARVVQDTDGRFAGLVTAALDPEWLALYLSATNYAPDMWSALVHGDGQLLAIVPRVAPGLEGVDLARPGSMFLRHREAGVRETVFRGRLLAIDQHRLIAQRTVTLAGVTMDHDLVLAMARDLDAVQAGWRREVAFVGLLFGLLLLLSGAGLAAMQGGDRRAAAAQRAARDALQATEQRWLMALQGSGLGVWDWNLPQGRIYYSPQWKAMLGYAEAAVGEGLDEWLERMHADDRPAAQVALERHLTGGTPAYEAEYRLRATDGRWRWVLSRGRVVERDADGGARRMVGTTTDLTDRHEAEALRAERDRAEAANRAKSEFLSRMSHELRTPLNAVLGFAQLLTARLGTQAPDEQRRYIGHIEKAGWHLLAMINDVLDLSRVESGRLELRIEAVALAPALDDVLGMIGPLARARALTLQAAPPPPGARVQADALRLRQILTNLLSNAVKYNVEGGRIEVAVQAAPGRWRVAVSDTGPGIPAADLEHLFEPFNRLGFSHSGVEGAGIGLTLTRWLVQEMRGTLAVRSRVGAGSTFEFELPAAEDAASA